MAMTGIRKHPEQHLLEGRNLASAKAGQQRVVHVRENRRHAIGDTLTSRRQYGSNHPSIRDALCSRQQAFFNQAINQARDRCGVDIKIA